MSDVELVWEVVLHEVGHYLGAVHSPDPHSVMRPILAAESATVWLLPFTAPSGELISWVIPATRFPSEAIFSD